MRDRLSGAVLSTMAMTLLLGAGEAAASKIVYSCAPDLCAVDPGSGSTSPITSDGATSVYRYPGLSRDGRRLAAARASDVVVGGYGANLTTRWTGSRAINGVAISPDGSAVGESHSYVVNQYGCPFTGGCLKLVDMSNATYTRGGPPTGTTRTHPGGGGVGFLGNGALLSSRYTIQDDLHQICVIADGAADSPCVARVLSRETLSAPAGSPDSKLIAAAISAPAPSKATSVQLYDAATGAPVRKLADNAGAPSFSPDGKQVAYGAADGWIHVVSVRGGKARRLVKGISPAWGGGDPPGAAVASKSLRSRTGRIAVRTRCRGRKTCAGRLAVKRGRTTLGKRSYRIKAGRSATVAVKLTRSGRRAVARARRQRVTVQVKPKGGRTVSRKLILRR